MKHSALTNQHKFPVLETNSVDLSFSVSSFATGWGAAITRTQRIDIATTDIGSEMPKTISFRLGRPTVKTFSFAFPELPASQAELKDKTSPAVKKRPHGTHTATHSTRLKPPTDIVKLEDRLYYMLQPPLETILSSESMHMPFDPFPYQYQGIAFLYPRFAAILASAAATSATRAWETPRS